MKQWIVDIVTSLAPRAFYVALQVRLVHFGRTDWVNRGDPTHTMCYFRNNEEAEQGAQDEPKIVHRLDRKVERLLFSPFPCDFFSESCRNQ